MRHPSHACNGACETAAGCNCWSGVAMIGRTTYPAKCTEADLDRHESARQQFLRLVRPSRPAGTSIADLLLASGAVEGPYRPTHPVTLTWRTRLARWWRRHVIDDYPTLR